MMLDAHTHNLQATDGIISVEPWTFDPGPDLSYSVGIHPWSSDRLTPDVVQRLKDVAAHPQVAAIGETGLDSLRGASLDEQMRLFDLHLDLAMRLGKPVIVHCVRTSQQVLRRIRAVRVDVPVVIHGMRGGERVAGPLIEAGFYLSFGPRFNPLTVQTVPLDKLLIETDDTGCNIKQVATAVAGARQMATDEVLLRVAANLADVLRCDGVVAG